MIAELDKPQTLSAADELRRCADWLEAHPCQNHVIVGVNKTATSIHLDLADMRLHFAGESVQKTVARDCTRYEISRDGIRFEATQYHSGSFAVQESECVL
jgi:hypothetical protein